MTRSPWGGANEKTVIRRVTPAPQESGTSSEHDSEEREQAAAATTPGAKPAVNNGAEHKPPQGVAAPHAREDDFQRGPPRPPVGIGSRPTPPDGTPRITADRMVHAAAPGAARSARAAEVAARATAGGTADLVEGEIERAGAHSVRAAGSPGHPPMPRGRSVPAPPGVLGQELTTFAPPLRDRGEAFLSAGVAGLAGIKSLEALAARFRTDLATLRGRLLPDGLSPHDRALRLWAFFLTYAPPAVARQLKEGRARAGELFSGALIEHGFPDLVDEATGKDGLATALSLLAAPSSEELARRAARVRIGPRPEGGPPPEQPPSRRRGSERPEIDRRFFAEELPVRGLSAAEHPGAAGPEHERSAAAETVLVAGPADAGQGPAQPGGVRERSWKDAREGKHSRKRLGPNMLWNVLHTLRGEGADSVLEKDRWNRITLIAIGALAGLLFMTIILASL